MPRPTAVSQRRRSIGVPASIRAAAAQTVANAGANATQSSIRSSTSCVTNWSFTASGMPSASEGQKRRPYRRIVSATSWPTVRSAGGSGGGRGSSVRG